MTKPREYDLVVPLHLIPVTIAQRIQERGGKLYRISVVRTHQHHYTVKCKCRAKIAMEPLEQPVDHPVNPLQEPITGPCRGNHRPELVSSTSSGDTGPESLAGQSKGKPELVPLTLRENLPQEPITGPSSEDKDDA
ncbi:MAG: hypothetical protein NTZ37_02545 [Methanoregula sp.]|nr:hypothetical protein [Methanoregula sp.]